MKRGGAARAAPAGYEARTQKVSVGSSENQANREAIESSLSNDGRYVAFSSYADNLVPDDANGNRADVFVHKPQLQEGIKRDLGGDKSRSVTVHPPDTGGSSLLLVASVLLFSVGRLLYVVVKRSAL